MGEKLKVIVTDTKCVTTHPSLIDSVDTYSPFTSGTPNESSVSVSLSLFPHLALCLSEL